MHARHGGRLRSRLGLAARKVAAVQAGGLLIRYADDFLILQATREAAEGMHAQAGELVDALRLQLNDDKPAVLDLRKPFEFLGLRFERREQWEAERGTRTTIAWQEPLPQREPVLLIG